MQLINKAESKKHNISFFSRYIFSISPRCTSCKEKVFINPSVLTGWLWVIVISILAMYLLYTREHFDYIEFALLWGILSYCVRPSMVFATKEEHDPRDGKIQAFTLFYALAMMQLYTLVAYVFGTSLSYSWAVLAIVMAITPLGYFAPAVEHCSVPSERPAVDEDRTTGSQVSRPSVRR